MKQTRGTVFEWFQTKKDTVFSFLVYRRMFTPYEEEHKFLDDSEFTSISYRFGYIEEVVDLGDDWLLGIRICDPDLDQKYGLEYYKLSEIRLEVHDEVQPGEDDDFEEDFE